MQAMWSSEAAQAMAALSDGVSVALVGPGGIGKSAGFVDILEMKLTDEAEPPWQLYLGTLPDGFGGKDAGINYNPFEYVEPDDLTDRRSLRENIEGDERAADYANNLGRIVVLDEVGALPADPTKLQRWLSAFNRLDVLAVLMVPTETPNATAQWIQREATLIDTDLAIIQSGHKRLPESVLGEYMVAAGSDSELIDFVLNPDNSALRHPRLFAKLLLTHLLYSELHSDKVPIPGRINEFNPHIATFDDLKAHFAGDHYMLSTEELADSRMASGQFARQVNGIELAYAQGWATSQELRRLAANLDLPYPDDDRLRTLNRAKRNPDRSLEYGSG